MKLVLWGYITWLIYLGVVFALWLIPWADQSPIRLEQSYQALTVAEAVFVVLLWPFLGSPGWRTKDKPYEGMLRYFVFGAGEVFLLACLAAPVVVFAAYTGEGGLGTVVVSQGYVVLLALCVWGVGAAGLGAAAIRWPCYLASAFALCGLVPLAAYLVAELTGGGVGWLKMASPIWMAAVLAGGASGLVASTGGACLGAATLASFGVAAIAWKAR